MIKKYLLLSLVCFSLLSLSACTIFQQASTEETTAKKKKKKKKNTDKTEDTDEEEVEEEEAYFSQVHCLFFSLFDFFCFSISFSRRSPIGCCA